MQNKILLPLQDRSYEIVIDSGAITNLDSFFLKNHYTKKIIITDKNLYDLHYSKLKEYLPQSHVVLVDAGEKSKSFSVFENVCEQILEIGIDRKSLIIAFGGGVVGDLSGFVSSVLLRGIDFIQIPTTLLAMVDSSVGGKTAINSRFGKNLIGTFFQPKFVICDIDFLKTLSTREFRSGYAEIVKYGLIANKDFFCELENNHKKIFSYDCNFLKYAITNSCQTKSDIVGDDERENGKRALLNFGHSFAHIFETETNYSQEILHGEAVAIGMIMAAEMSENLAMISKNDVDRIRNHLIDCGFNVDIKNIRNSWNKENLIKHIFKDKKNHNQELTFILLKSIGDAIIKKDVSLESFKKIIDNHL